MKKLMILSTLWFVLSCAGLIGTLVYVLRAPSGATDAPAAERVEANGKNNHTEKHNNKVAENITIQSKADDIELSCKAWQQKVAELIKTGKWKELEAVLSRLPVTTNIMVGEEKEVDYTPVDLSGVYGIEDKIAKILERFKNADGYQSPNELLKQLISLGEDAIDPLVKMLSDIKEQQPYQWACHDVIVEALEGLLNEKHADLIVKLFKEENTFVEFICKYRFKEAEATVMTKLAKCEGYGALSENALVDAALMYDGKKAVDILIASLKEGRVIGNAAERLASIPGLDVAEAFREAAAKARDEWHKEKLFNPMLDKGMPESLDLALDLLSNANSDTEYIRDQVSRKIGNYFGIIGDSSEIRDWLGKNRGNIEWDAQALRFIVRGASWK